MAADPQEVSGNSAPGSSFWQLLAPRSRPPGAAIVSIANQKGGVAKTTTAINLGAGLALEGARVLVVDVDSQANATTGLGLDHRALETSTYDLLLGGAALSDVVVGTAVDGLSCAPASVDLAGAEVELVGMERRETRLWEALVAARDAYDIVLLDCPPSLGLLTVNALVAAHDLIVPVQCEYYALEGLGQLLANAERVRTTLNPALRIAGFLLTMYDARTKLSSEVDEEVRRHFGERVFGTVVPRSVRLSESPSYGEPVVTLDPASRGAIAYRLLAREVMSKYAIERADRRDPGVAAATPGPHGRGYGTVAPEPPRLDGAWPRREPWTVAR